MTDWPQALEKLRHTVGLWTMTLDGQSPARAAEIASDVETMGYWALWFSEAYGREAFTNAGLLLANTSSLVVATGIANIWARDAVASANAAQTLSAAYDNRFVLGLGVSHEPLVKRMRGHDYQTPYTVMSEYLDAMDRSKMLAEEGSTRYARVIAALGPKMLELAATAADGAHPYLVTPEHTALARPPWVRSSSASSRRSCWAKVARSFCGAPTSTWSSTRGYPTTGIAGSAGI